jgi:hypothetical protein
MPDVKRNQKNQNRDCRGSAISLFILDDKGNNANAEFHMFTQIRCEQKKRGAE